MNSSGKITPKEWRQYVEVEMLGHGFTTQEREAVRSAFEGELRDTDLGEPKPFFGQPQPGISENELESTLAGLRDKSSTLSKGLKIHLSPEKLDKLEAILDRALQNNKERLF